jgi:4-phospho-D-threonate 3-dehydrogenase / 4-phospho-D-erythronate 3-dehydrogenase
MPNPIVAVTMGDPAGIGPEICLSALANPAVTDRVRPILIGDAYRLELARAALSAGGRCPRVPPSPQVIDDPGEAAFVPGRVELIDLRNVPPSVTWGTLDAGAGRAAFEYLERAVELARAGTVDAICTAPLNKEAWKMAGVPYPGHTEALAHLSGTRRYAMMLVNERLRVVHVSTHVPLRKAIALVTVERVLETILLADEALKRYVVNDPHLALAGLNPHAGESGLFGDEEAATLQPAIDQARRLGVNVAGPAPPDTVFARAAGGEFDAVIALYHDQGHIPVKMLGLDTGVNVTIGLPFLRTSVDHGTAFDLAGRGVARDASMIAALHTAADFLSRGTKVGRGMS